MTLKLSYPSQLYWHTTNVSESRRKEFKYITCNTDLEYTCWTDNTFW